MVSMIKMPGLLSIEVDMQQTFVVSQVVDLSLQEAFVRTDGKCALRTCVRLALCNVSTNLVNQMTVAFNYSYFNWDESLTITHMTEKKISSLTSLKLYSKNKHLVSSTQNSHTSNSEQESYK